MWYFLNHLHTRINPKDCFALARRDEQKVSEVLGEHFNGGLLGIAVEVGPNASHDHRMN